MPIEAIFVMLIGLAVIVIVITVLVSIVNLSCRAARDKGYEDLEGTLWFLGIFATVIAPLLVVAALPDKRLREALTNNNVVAPKDELPAI